MRDQFMMNDRLYIIPQDEENRISLLNIDRKSKEDLRRYFKISTEHDWVNNTVANLVVENIIKTLSIEIVDDQQSIPINFFNVFTSTVTVKRNEDAEKEGNINISFTPGKEIETLIDNSGQFFEIGDEDRVRLEVLIQPDPKTGKFIVNPEVDLNISEYDMKRLYKVDKVTRLELSEKYGIPIPDKSASTLSITYVFMINIFKYLMEKITLTGKPSASVNFNDNIEIHAIVKDDNTVTMSMRPGMSAKLIIKSDETTEYEDYDD